MLSGRSVRMLSLLSVWFLMAFLMLMFSVCKVHAQDMSDMYEYCEPYVDEVQGSVTGFYRLDCQICTNDYDQFDFDCTVRYMRYSDTSSDFYMDGKLKIYATYVISTEYLNITLTSFPIYEGDYDPIMVYTPSHTYYVRFRDAFIETRHGKLTQYGGYIYIDGQTYSVTPDLFGIIL